MTSLRRLLTVRHFLMGAALVAYCGCALVRILLSKPGNNEAWFANPALDLIARHQMGTPTIDGVGTALAGIGEHTYWTMPFYSLAQVPWYWLLGFSLLLQRLFSLFCGIGVLICIYLLVKKLSSQWVAALSVIFIACDFAFVGGASVGRMDMLCAWLAFAGLALYVNLRETRLREALLLSNVAVALSCMTHPYGALGLTSLWVLILYFDRKRLGWREVGLIGAPYVVVLAMWGGYISRAPQSFLLQMRENARGVQADSGGSERFNLLLHPRWALSSEIRYRYIASYHSAVIPTVYILGLLVLIALAWRKRRTEHVVFAMIAFIYFAELTLLEGLKRSSYLVHSIPVLAIALASVLCAVKLPRAAIAAGVAVLLLFQGATELRYGKADQRARDYVLVMKLLDANRTPGEAVIAPSEFAYGLGFEGQVMDDWHIGYYSGKSPRFIVLGGLARNWLTAHGKDSPELAAFVDERLERGYVVVVENPTNTVYAKRDRAAGIDLPVTDTSDASIAKFLWGLRPHAQL